MHKYLQDVGLDLVAPAADGAVGEALLKRHRHRLLDQLPLQGRLHPIDRPRQRAGSLAGPVKPARDRSVMPFLCQITAEWFL